LVDYVHTVTVQGTIGPDAPEYAGNNQIQPTHNLADMMNRTSSSTPIVFKDPIETLASPALLMLQKSGSPTNNFMEKTKFAVAEQIHKFENQTRTSSQLSQDIYKHTIDQLPQEWKPVANAMLHLLGDDLASGISQAYGELKHGDGTGYL